MPRDMAISTAFFMARRKAMRRSSWRATFSATSCGLDLGLLHFLDVEEDLLAGELGELFLDVLDFLALACR
jgi:hypothetical protein